MEYLSNNRDRNCLNKWFAHTLYFQQMHQEYDFNVAQNVMYYYIGPYP